MAKSKRAPRNRTLTLTPTEQERYAEDLLRVAEPISSADSVCDRILLGDCLNVLPLVPDACVDLVFADPPYNLGKSFNGKPWAKLSLAEYEAWLRVWLAEISRVLKPKGSLYVCADWRFSSAVHRTLDELFTIKNRITWEREKGRGAKTNWKNASEDIWFAVKNAGNYCFNVDAVKLKRRVIAPYRDQSGKPRDWTGGRSGRFRLTHPSNLWTDLTVPFWSMPENTDHPTQKPEKLLAKIILASSNPGEMILDPFLGSGTTAVAARKLARHFIGIEMDERYCCLAAKRLDHISAVSRIQGYEDGVFYERNSKPN